MKLVYRNAYDGTVRRHNVCKRHVAIDTSVKQTERTIFLQVISVEQKLSLLSSAFFEEEMPKVSVNFG